jgi:heat shock protein HslJ
MRLFAISTLLVAGALASGCAVAPAPPTLAGTAWQLLSIQSMDDAQGTLRIADPNLYTIAFGSDGRAALRVDCNRATGTWHAEPGVSAVSGSLTFGPLAATRAMCAPPSIDLKVLRDLSDVRSYLFKDGQLHMSLMADGGIYRWALAPR